MCQGKLLHNWNKWKEIKNIDNNIAVHITQEKICQRCGLKKVKTERIFSKDR